VNTIDPTLVCPHCKNNVHLTESLAAPLLASARAEFQQQLNAKEAEIARREETARAFEKKMTDDRRALDDIIRQKTREQLTTERTRIAEEEKEKARVASSLELEAAQRKIHEAQHLLADREAKLTQAQNAEADFLKKQRELDTQKRELELTIQKRLHDERAQILNQAKKQAEDGLKLTVSEKDQMIASLKSKIDDLQRKVEQGSQQFQGEVLEVELESLLRQKFPMDAIEPVGKGEFGGDVVQRVSGSTGQTSGTILWETKRTKTWSDGWLVKLRHDQRTAKAEIAVIVSQSLPKGVEHFDLIDGVWVVSVQTMMPVAVALRQTLLQLHGARMSAEGQQTKTALVYQYLTGPRFRQRVEAMLEAVSSMRSDLHQERQAIMRLWAKRETQIDHMMAAAGGMWGDFQGIAGRSLPELEALEIEQLGKVEDAKPDNHLDQVALPGFQ